MLLRRLSPHGMMKRKPKISRNSFGRLADLSYPNQQGEIALRNLAAGQYQITSRLFAKYWYLRSINLPAPIRSGVATPPSSKPVDAVANWITLRSGERLPD